MKSVQSYRRYHARDCLSHLIMACIMFTLIATGGCKKSDQQSARSSKELSLDCGSGVSMKLTPIPAGSFMMGSPTGEIKRGSDEGPQHRVKISRPYYMGTYEVTQAQYQAVMGASPSKLNGSNNPVEYVSWYDAVAFCRSLSAKTGRKVRLPTEAQWEYACRAGTTTPFSTGQTISADQANYVGWETYGNGRTGVNRNKTTPVGSFPPNAFGLYDMHGNVWEWCSDFYGENYYANANPVDPKGPNTGEYRVLRGGSWIDHPRNCRSANRSVISPDFRIYFRGFRVSVDF